MENNNNVDLNLKIKNLEKKKQDTITHYTKMEKNIIKLYNSVKLDKLKRRQDLDETTFQIQEYTDLISNLENTSNLSLKYHENERNLLLAEIKKESERLKSMESDYQTLLESDKQLSIPQQHEPISLDSTQLKDVQYQYYQLKNKVLETQILHRNKENHLRQLISEQELKIQLHENTIKEQERKAHYKLELDNLLKELEIEETKILNKSQQQHQPQSPRVITPVATIEEQLPKQPPLSSSPQPTIKSPDISKTINVKPLHFTKPPSIQYSISITPELTYPTSEIIQPIQISYSIDDDTVLSLKSKIYEYIQQSQCLPLKSEFKSIDEISLKSSSHFYFSNEPKVILKSIPYFSQQQTLTESPTLIITSKRRENQFYIQSSLIIENFIDFTKSTNEEIIYLRNKMIFFLEQIVYYQGSIRNDISSNLVTGKLNQLLLDIKSPPSNSLISRTRKPTMISGIVPDYKSITQNNNNNNNNNSNSGWKVATPTLKKELSANSVQNSSGSPSSSSLFNGQGQCTIRLYITRDIIKTFVCKIQSTIGELQDKIYQKFTKIIILSENPSSQIEEITIDEMKSRYIIKIRGLEIYLINPSQLLSSIDFINTKSRRQKKIDLLLLPASGNSPTRINNNDMYRYLNLSYKYQCELLENFEKQQLVITTPDQNQNRKNSGSGSDLQVTGKSSNGSLLNLSYNIKKKNLRIKIGGLKNFSIDLLTSQMNNSQSSIYIVCQVYQFEGTKIGEEMISPKIPITSNPSWLAWLEGVSFDKIPGNAYLYFQVKINDFLICWGKHKLWNYKNRLNFGYTVLPLTTSIPNSQITLSFEFEFNASSIMYKEDIEFQPRENNDESQHDDMAGDDEDELSHDDIKTVQSLLQRDSLSKLTPQDKESCWKFRYYIKNHCKPNSIAKLVRSVPWGDPYSTQEFYYLLRQWNKLSNPVDALELLSSKYQDTQVRKFAIENLRSMSDQEFEMYLPQIIQSIKHESYHLSLLFQFILSRALLSNYNLAGNPSSLSHSLFWLIKSELVSSQQQNQLEWYERYQLLLECYLRGCSESQLLEITKEYELYLKLKSIAIGIKSIPAAKRKEHLCSSLSNTKIPNNFLVPINTEFRGKGIDINSAKVKESKTIPLFLGLQNLDPLGDNLHVIFKAGDDLRQDQLTLQMIKLMDKLWLEEGIDLQTISYQCVATGPSEGVIEIVQDSITIAEIQKLSGGVTAAFNETAISTWLKQENPSDFEYSNSVENFIRSCAGCCVYSYILGIGDRHNDNIMIMKSGHLFHIDFGRFLGNVQTWKGIKRERAPFVFPNSFAHIIGDNFKNFEDLCCRAYNIIRKHSNVFINLFSMMISTGMPELNQEEDIHYLKDALALDLTPEQASAKFVQMISDSLKTISTDLNFAVHILANPN
ncbi:phosphatidylinositol 3-kinase [Tieghemostelium lacteum]|uniref:Phosphatidylinositol 3-kinase n=1 Tax=Tieghemostelium lacteum TaxID=361077 RepID=A0A151Z6M8_TIELA|nr:phosphatidylinositol 3-kinase [Tieghemostelium lacteum]|eukprot:KYQ89621.1 phosphatidylinositol 3-kinase [Tieghemostelium lacteum]